MRGFFGGLIVGAVLLGGGVAVLSVMSPMPQRPDVSSDAPGATSEAMQGQAETGEDSGVAEVGRDADLVEAAPAAPSAPGQNADGTQTDDLKPLERADTKPADKPQVGEASAPQNNDSAADATTPEAPQTGSPVTPPVAGTALAAPEGDASASVETGADPSQPSAMTDSVATPQAPVTDEQTPSVGDTDSAPASGTTASAPAPEAETDPEVATDPGATPQPDSAAATDESATNAEASETETTAADTTDAGGDSATPDTGEPAEVAALPQTDRQPEVPSESQPDAETDAQSDPDTKQDVTRPRLGTSVVPLTERKSTPRFVGNSTEGTATPPAADASEDVAAVSASDPAIKRFAQPFDDAGDRPLMSILLIDEPGSIGAEALSEFPYPLSFAIDATDPEAAKKMAAYREAGFEVTALIDMPTVATAQDAEVSMSVWLQTLPEIVAIVEGTGSGLQGNRGLSDQIAAIAKSAGLGLVTQSKGLNTAQKLALRSGVPAAIVFRDFDGAGQTPTVMRRFLDQAAFRAGQEGAVIMLGRVQPDTISALLLWGLQDRAQRVSLAPLSAVLLRGIEPAK